MKKKTVKNISYLSQAFLLGLLLNIGGIKPDSWIFWAICGIIVLNFEPLE